MEFPFYVSKVLQLDRDNFAILDVTKLNTRSGSNNWNPSLGKSDSKGEYLAQILDQMGEASSRAQGLGHTITTYTKFLASGDNRLYLKVDNNRVCGILKVGKKNLFHYDGTGKVKEIKPLCVLDFYVHESMQRAGVGKLLFEKMLQEERIEPNKLAYDRPSPKLIGFLQKHYGLVKYVPQNNNFVVYNQYWEETKTDNRKEQNFQSDRLNQYSRPPLTTEFHKVGRSILENTNDMSHNYSRYQDQKFSNHPQYYEVKGEISSPSQHTRRSLGGTNNDRQIYENRGANHTSFRTLESRLKLKEEDSSNHRDAQTESFMSHQKQSHNEYYSRPPWASYGPGLDSFKSSLAYGNHYDQANSNFSHNRRK